MRSLAVLVGVCLASAAWAGKASNPPFLGIKMADAGQSCLVQSITSGSGAADAGMEIGDRMVSIDDVTTPNCNTVMAQIVAHQVGDIARIEVVRGVNRVVVRAKLTTRAEVVHHRIVNHALDSTEVTDLENLQTYDLDDLRGFTTIIGVFDLQHCGCESMFRKIVDATDKKKTRVLALSSGAGHSLDSLQSTRNFGTQVYVAGDDYFDRMGLDREDNRAYFLVVDPHGVIRFIAPMAADADDLDAAIEELLAATEQAARHR